MNSENARPSLANHLIAGARNYFARLVLVLSVALWNLALLAGLTVALEAISRLRLGHRVEPLLMSFVILLYLVGALGALFLAARPNQAASLFLQIRQKLPLVRLALTSWLRKVGRYTNRALISIIGTTAGAILLWRSSAAISPTAQELGAFVLAAGAMLGTILALVLSLSIIPVQRAMETFTPSIGKLYRNDPQSQFVIMTLAVFVLFSFSLGLIDIGLSLALVAFMQLTVIAMSLDLVRWHFTRVTQLLDPREAISRLKQLVLTYINGFQTEMSKIALAQWRSLPSEEREKHSRAQIESHLYSLLPQHVTNINTTADDLAEIAHRAIAKNETQSAAYAISALAEIATRYAEKRKDNFRIYPSTKALGAFETDLDQVLNAVYEHLLAVSRDAALKGAEAISIAVVSAFQKIGVMAAGISRPNVNLGLSPLAFSCIYYLGEVVSTAQRRELHDVALHGSRALVEITRTVPREAAPDVFYRAAESWHSIALHSLLSGKPELINETVEDMMALAHHLLNGRYYKFNHLLRKMLEMIESLAPAALVLERRLGTLGLNVPLSAAYDLNRSNSLGNLISDAASTVAPQEKAWISPYSDFIEINEVVTRHLNTLGEKVDFAGSFLLWHITRMIKFIAHLCLQLARDPVTSDPRHLNDLVAQVPWYMAFFWRSFSAASRADRTGADEACDALAVIGMEFYDSGFKRVAEAAASDITSIVQSYCKSGGTAVDLYDVADLVVYLWHIRFLATARGDSDFVSKVDGQIQRAKALPDDAWIRVQGIVELRKRQLSEELSEEDWAVPTDDATDVLRRLLRGVR